MSDITSRLIDKGKALNLPAEAKLCPVDRFVINAEGQRVKLPSCGGSYDHPSKPKQYRCPKCTYLWWDEPL